MLRKVATIACIMNESLNHSIVHLFHLFITLNYSITLLLLRDARTIFICGVKTDKVTGNNMQVM